jgi:hypothetical protein
VQYEFLWRQLLIYEKHSSMSKNIFQIVLVNLTNWIGVSSKYFTVVQVNILNSILFIQLEFITQLSLLIFENSPGWDYVLSTAIIREIVNAHIPSQTTPFPVYPLSQVQKKDPSLLLQVEFVWQLSIDREHSSMSKVI